MARPTSSTFRAPPHFVVAVICMRARCPGLLSRLPMAILRGTPGGPTPSPERTHMPLVVRSIVPRSGNPQEAYTRWLSALDRDAADVAPSTKQGRQRTWQAVGPAGTFAPIAAHEGRPSVSLSCWASP
jgi:hypothetical protein